MTGTSDVSIESLSPLFPGRPVRSYPALVSTEADALAWARAGAPEGALVVAEYQVSARGWGGREWDVRPGLDLAFSLVLRPGPVGGEEGWLYLAASVGLADVLGVGARLRWPDEIRAGGRVAGRVAVRRGAWPADWAVISVLVVDATPPRGPLLARLVGALEARCRAPAEEVLADYVPRCEDLGRPLRARLLPLGPGGLQVVGRGVEVRGDGALILETAAGSRVPVWPGYVGALEDDPSADVRADPDRGP